jgi:hypothetical protein
LEFTFRDIPERKDDIDRMIEAHDSIKHSKQKEKEATADLKFYRLENLIARRPFLLSNVVLRQNPNNVYEWLNRVKLCEQIAMGISDEGGD